MKNEDLPIELLHVDSRLSTPTKGPPKSLITKEGWQEFVNFKPIPKPPVLDKSVVMSWSKQSQLRYQAIRKRYHATQQPLNTPSLNSITDTVVRMALTGIDLPPGVRPGALVNGQPTLGKSTILVEIGRQFERQLRRRCALNEDEDPDDQFIPVIYTTLSANETCKGLTSRLLNYFGCPYNRNDRESDLQAKLADQAAKCSTTLILVDDIHFLNGTGKTAQAVNTHLKALASSIYATFVYAGINVQGTGLLFEGNAEAQAQAAQTQRRFRRMDIVPFESGAKDFQNVLAALENQLLLLNGRSGDVTGLSEYIHDRTDGYLGAMTALIRDGASVAIETGAERISMSILDSVNIDYASEERYSRLIPSNSKAKPS